MVVKIIKEVYGDIEEVVIHEVAEITYSKEQSHIYLRSVDGVGVNFHFLYTLNNIEAINNYKKGTLILKH